MTHIDLRHVGKLARLELSPEELQVFESQVSGILDFAEKLKEVNVDGIEPTSHPLSLSNVFRADEPAPSLDIEKFLKFAPGSRGRFFEVPKIIEQK